VSLDQPDLFDELDQVETVISDAHDEVDSGGDGLMGDGTLKGTHHAQPARQGEAGEPSKEDAQ